MKLNGIASETDYDYKSSSFNNWYDGYGGDISSLSNYGGNSDSSDIYIPALDMCDDCWVSVYVKPYYDACQYSIVATMNDVPIFLQGEISFIILYLVALLYGQHFCAFRWATNEKKQY